MQGVKCVSFGNKDLGLCSIDIVISEQRSQLTEVIPQDGAIPKPDVFRAVHTAQSIFKIKGRYNVIFSWYSIDQLILFDIDICVHNYQLHVIVSSMLHMYLLTFSLWYMRADVRYILIHCINWYC